MLLALTTLGIAAGCSDGEQSPAAAREGEANQPATEAAAPDETPAPDPTPPGSLGAGGAVPLASGVVMVPAATSLETPGFHAS